MKLSKVIQKLNAFADPKIAVFDWVGFLVPSDEKGVKKIGITLDASLHTIHEALDNNCDLLITHHGPLDKDFDPKSQLDKRRITLAKKHNLPIFRMHLNLDFCKNGTAETLTRLLGFSEFTTAPTVYHGIELKVGATIVDGKFTLNDILQRVKKLHPNSLRVVKSKKRRFKRIAIAPGEGFQPEFLEQLPSPDVFISGELNHIAIVRAQDLNICLVEATHASTENEPLKIIAKKLEKVLLVPILFIESKDNLQII